MSEENLNAQEGAKEGDKEKGSGEQDKYVSKAELAALNESVRVQAQKNDDIYKLITSPEFFGRNAPPTVPVQEEKGLSSEELDKLEPSQLVGHMLKEVSKMLDKNNAKQEENLKNVAATIQRVTDSEADKDAARQIESVKQTFGDDEFEKYRPAMIKIVSATPNITAKQAFLIAKGEADPPKKKEVPRGTHSEKPGQSAEFTDTNLTLKDAADKAYNKAFGADENPI